MFCVIGSINMDLVVDVQRFPMPGETLTGTRFATHPGGKGANQAVALSRLGAQVRMIGSVGNDAFGSSYLETFRTERVDAESVETSPDLPTGVAVIEVNGAGENHIVIVPGANAQVDHALIDRARNRIAMCDYALFQLEIPFETTEYALGVAGSEGCKTILDPAPARALPESMLSRVDYLTPNAHEARILSGIEVTDEQSARSAAEALMAMGARRIVIKAGELGAYLLSEAGFASIPGFPVEVVDTTAAGDAFNAGLARALFSGEELVDAIRYANAAGALACRAAGAQAAMPTDEAVRAFLKERLS